MIQNGEFEGPQLHIVSYFFFLQDKMANIQIDSKKLGEAVYVYSPENFWIRLEESKVEYRNLVLKLLNDYKDAINE